MIKLIKEFIEAVKYIRDKKPLNQFDLDEIAKNDGWYTIIFKKEIGEIVRLNCYEYKLTKKDIGQVIKKFNLN